VSLGGSVTDGGFAIIPKVLTAKDMAELVAALAKSPQQRSRGRS
jgi:hypothetical protein